MRSIIFITMFCFSVCVSAQDAWQLVGNKNLLLDCYGYTLGYYGYSNTIPIHGSEYFVLKSTDGLQSFDVVLHNSTANGGRWIAGVFVVDENVVFVNSVIDGVAGVMRSTDQGNTWTSIGVGGVGDCRMHFLDAEYGYYADNIAMYPPNGGIFTRYDHGVKTTLMNTLEYSFDSYTRMSFNCHEIGIICTKNKILEQYILFVTTNSADTLTEVILPETYFIKDVCVLQDTSSLVCCKDGKILRSENLFETWEDINTGCTDILFAIDFYDELFGYAVGENGQVLHSEDGGLSWENVAFPSSVSLVKVWCIEPDKCIVQASNGNIYRNFLLTNTEEIPSEEISIYPNPVHATLQFELPENCKDFEICLFNNLGVLVYSEKNKNTIDMSSYSPGIYFAELRAGAKFIRKKIIKN